MHLNLCTVHKRMYTGASNTPHPHPKGWGGGWALGVGGRVFEAPVHMSLCTGHKRISTVHKLPEVEVHGFVLQARLPSFSGLGILYHMFSWPAEGVARIRLVRNLSICQCSFLVQHSADVHAVSENDMRPRWSDFLCLMHHLERTSRFW